MLSETQIRAELIRGMKRIAVPYQAALDVLRNESAFEAGNVQEITARLQPSLAIIAECEKILDPLRKEWNRLSTKPDSSLRQLIDQQSLLLQELLERLGALERKAVTSKANLASQLDESQRRSAMKRAYRS